MTRRKTNHQKLHPYIRRAGPALLLLLVLLLFAGITALAQDEDLNSEIIELNTDPVIQESAVGILPASAYDWVVVVGYNPGVTDNVGRSARIAIEDLTGHPFRPGEAVYTEREYFLSGGELSHDDAWRVHFQQHGTFFRLQLSIGHRAVI